MDRIDPIDLFGFLHRINIRYVDHDGLVVGTNQHAFERIFRVGIDFLVGNEWRNIDEVAFLRFRHIFEAVAPAQPRLSPDNENDAF